MRYKDIYEEARRLLMICNACRYCEGICPVWTAIEFRTDFKETDIDYMAFLCHDCRTCYYVCPYSPPHELNLNPPKIFSAIRFIDYTKYSPRFFKRIYEKPIISTIILQIIGIALAFTVAFYNLGFDLNRFFVVSRFYYVFPHDQIYIGGLILAIYIALTLLYQSTMFVRGIGIKELSDLFLSSFLLALKDVVFHTWFRDGILSCGYRNEDYYMFKKLFWVFHVMIMYGALLLILATITAAVYKNVFGIFSPYPFYSIPVLLGVTGGILALLGLLIVVYSYKGSEEVELRAREEKSLNLAFSISILLPVITGLLTLISRSTNFMSMIYIVHLGTVIGFFLYIPFSKFNHTIFRYLTLAKYYSEIFSREHFRINPDSKKRKVRIILIA